MQGNLSLRVIYLIVLGLLSVAASAQDRYRGSISGSINETNGAHFAFWGSVEEFGQEQKFYYSQHSGQRAAWTDKALHIDASQENKYSMLFKILRREEDTFHADIKIFEHFIVETAPGKGVIESRLFHKQQVKGELNTLSEFSIINEGKAQIQVTINIDREFTLEEIKQRFQSGKARKVSRP